MPPGSSTIELQAIFTRWIRFFEHSTINIIYQARDAVPQPLDPTKADDVHLLYEEVKARFEAILNEIEAKPEQ